MKKRKFGHLSREERFILSSYLKDGLSLRDVARKLERSAGGLSTEIAQNGRDGTREGYDPGFADMSARFRKWDANRRNPMKCREVMRYVLGKLTEEEWSPVQIAERIGKDYPKDPRMRISHETVYQFINSDEGKELGLGKRLRHGRYRKPHKKKHMPSNPKKQAIPNRISIHDRPGIVSRKGRYGDWEADTMIGRLKKGQALAVQKERRSQSVRLKRVRDKSAGETGRAIQNSLRPFPVSMRRTMTFDNGTENSGHKKLHSLGIETYFCDPYASWQKGSVENIIGLIRQYIPKGIRLEDVTDKELRRIEDKLNNRPRKCLGWKTPNEVLSNHLKRLGVQIPA
jgi:IS30 family transposase